MSDDPISFDHLSSLDPKKLEIIKFVISSCHGKPLELILPDLMAASSRLSEQGLSFTNEEISTISSCHIHGTANGSCDMPCALN